MEHIDEMPEQGSRSPNFTADRSGWPGVISITMGTFLLVTTEFLPIGLLSPIASSFGVSEGLAGLAVTAPGLVAAFAAPILTILAGNRDRRSVIIALTLAIIASNIVGALAPTFAVFLVGRLILGLAVGGLWTFAVAVARRLVSETTGARATSIVSMGISAGTVFGMPLGAVAGDFAGWRMVFTANAVLGVAILLMQMRFLPHVATTEPVNLGRLLAFSKVRMARIGLVASGLVAGGHFIAYTFLEPYLSNTLSFGRAGLAMALTGYAVAGIVGSLLGERLAVRNIRFAFTIASAVVGVSVLASVAAVGAPASALAIVMVWGLAFGAVPVCVQIWMFTASPKLYEAGSALMVSAFQIALSAGAAIGGLLIDTRGIATTFLVSGVIAVAGAALALRAPMVRRDRIVSSGKQS